MSIKANLKRVILLTAIFLSYSSCSESSPEVSPTDSRDDLVVKTEVFTTSFGENGVQWGGYERLSSWTGSASL